MGTRRTPQRPVCFDLNCTPMNSPQSSATPAWWGGTNFLPQLGQATVVPAWWVVPGDCFTMARFLRPLKTRRSAFQYASWQDRHSVAPAPHDARRQLPLRASCANARDTHRLSDNASTREHGYLARWGVPEGSGAVVKPWSHWPAG